MQSRSLDKQNKNREVGGGVEGLMEAFFLFFVSFFLSFFLLQRMILSPTSCITEFAERTSLRYGKGAGYCSRAVCLGMFYG